MTMSGDVTFDVMHHVYSPCNNVCQCTWSQFNKNFNVNMISSIELSTYSIWLIKWSKKSLWNAMVIFILFTCPCSIFTIETFMISMHEMLRSIRISDRYMIKNTKMLTVNSPAHFVKWYHLQCHKEIPLKIGFFWWWWKLMIFSLGITPKLLNKVEFTVEFWK